MFNKELEKLSVRELDKFFEDWEDYSNSYEFEEMSQFEYNENFEQFILTYVEMIKENKK